MFGAIACMFGMSGVLKRQPARLAFYSLYSWFELAMSMFFTTILAFAGYSFKDDVCKSLVGNNPETSPEDKQKLIDMCQENYPRLLAIVIMGMCVGIVIRLHFCLAIRAYTRQLAHEVAMENSMARVITVFPNGQSFPSQPVMIVQPTTPEYLPAYSEKSPLLK